MNPRPPAPWRTIAWPVGLALLLTGSVAAGLSRPAPPERGDLTPLVTELQSLVGANGLFKRPGLSSDGKPSWSASGYGLPALSLLSDAKPAPPSPASLTKTLDVAIAAEPLWGRWYGVQVEQSTGITIPGTWAGDVAGVPLLSDNPETVIAETAALAEVVSAKSVTLPDEQVRRLADQLGTAVTTARGAYSQCRALRAAGLLGIDTQTWHLDAPTSVATDGPFSVEAVMAAYGALCTADLLGQPLSVEGRRSIVRWMSPHLSFDVAGFEFETYFTVRTWTMAGGDRARLAGIADRLRARLDGASGLFRAHVVQLGTLENTYYAAVLAAGAFPAVVERRTVDAVRRSAEEFSGKESITDMLMCAAILRYAEQPDSSLEDRATELAVRWLRGGVGRDGVVRAARTVDLLQRLGRDVPPITAEPFADVTQEDRYLVWVLLGIADHLANADAIRERYAPETAEATTALASPDGLLVKEVVPALAVARRSGGARWDPSAVQDWSDWLRGCEGFKTLYRPLLAESGCTLEATVQVLAAGLGDGPGRPS